MIDGLMNNKAPKKKKERTSVLKKLREKQAAIAMRSGKQPQEQMMDMERRKQYIVVQLSRQKSKIFIMN